MIVGEEERQTPDRQGIETTVDPDTRSAPAVNSNQHQRVIGLRCLIYTVKAQVKVPSLDITTTGRCTSRGNQLHSLLSVESHSVSFSSLLTRISRQVTKCSAVFLHSMTSQLGKTLSPTLFPSSLLTPSRTQKTPLNLQPCMFLFPLPLPRP